MATPLEKLLEYLVKDGLLTRERADECLRAQAEAIEKGGNSSMTHIVVSKGGVDPARLSMALLSVKEVSLVCPKCRKRHSTKKANLDMTYPCKRCGTALEAEDVVPSGSGPIRRMEDPSPPEVIEARKDPKRVFGKYTLLQELGRGGYAVVYQAWDSLLAQHVALKLIRAEEEGLTDAPRPGEAEILREARIAARLQHPNIVRIWEVGTQGDRHFLSMEYIDGKSLSRTLKGEGRAKGSRMPRFYSDMKRLLVTLRDVARALHHAHSNRPPIVHRDVKPQNILVDRKGRACLVDFGLAREMKPGAGRLTISGITKGTPCYMAPEQALGRHTEIDARTDVWALGAILYEFLAGRPPFDGATEREILNQVVHEDPKRPCDVLKGQGLVAPALVDLEKIALKALEKDRSRRYATAGEFAEEIDRFLTGQTVQAKISSGVAQFFRWVGRRKALSAAIAAAVVMTGVTLGVLIRGGGPPKIVERVVMEKDPYARLSRAAREIERIAADLQFDLALRRYQELIDGEPDPVERGLLRQRLEDVRLQRSVLEGLVQRIQKEPRDYAPFRLKTGLPEPARVIDASMERLLLRRRSEDEEVAWGRVDPRQFATLVRDYWPQIDGRSALGFGVWCLRQGLMEEAASVFKHQSEPQAQRYIEELAVRSKAPAPAPPLDPAVESAREKILRQAEDALARGDYVIARARFERVLMLKPDDADAAAGLQRTSELERAREAEKPAAKDPDPNRVTPDPAPAPAVAPLDPIPAAGAKTTASGPTPEQVRTVGWIHTTFASDLRNRNLHGAASVWLTGIGTSATDAAAFAPALNRIAGGNPGAPEVRKALGEVEKALATGLRDPELGLRILFDLRDLFCVALVYGEVGPAVERVIQAREVVELQSFPGKPKLGTLERIRGTLNFSETVSSGGQKATIGWPVNLWGGTGTRLNAVDLVGFVRKEHRKRAVAADWRTVLGEGLLLLYEGAVQSAGDSPELLEAVKLASEEDQKILRMPEYLRLAHAAPSWSSDLLSAESQAQWSRNGDTIVFDGQGMLFKAGADVVTGFEGAKLQPGMRLEALFRVEAYDATGQSYFAVGLLEVGADGREKWREAAQGVMTDGVPRFYLRSFGGASGDTKTNACRPDASGWSRLSLEINGGEVVLVADGERSSVRFTGAERKVAVVANQAQLRVGALKITLAGAAAGAGAPSRTAPAEAEVPVSRLMAMGLEKNVAGDYRGSVDDFNKVIARSGSDALAYYYRAFPRMNLRDYTGAIADCDRAIGLAGGQGGLIAQCQSARARVKQFQGDSDGAIADYSYAIGNKTDFAEPYRGRGLLVHHKGQWSAAIADLTRAIQLEPNRAEDHFLRGRCYYDAAKFDEAAADLRRAIDLGVKNEDYTRLYLWMSLARQGQAAAARADLKVYASRRPDPPAQAAWFRQVAALLVDDLTEEAILKQAESERDDRKRREYVCEACFYSGTKRLLAGDKSGAAALFRRSLDTGITTFMEYTSSLAEMERLGIAAPNQKDALSRLPVAWESTKGGWYYRSLKDDFNGALDVRPREGYLLAFGWVRTDKEYTWLQVGIPAGDTCRWVFMNQQGELGEAEYKLTLAKTLLGTWTYRSGGGARAADLARPTSSSVLDAALRSLASRSEKDFFKSEADARAWIERSLGELRR